MLTNQYTWVDQPDTVYQVMPWLQMQASQWKRFHFPLWDPYQWAGQPIVGQVQTGTLNPLNWILFSIPFTSFISIGVLHWYFVFIHFLAILFCYWLCRDLQISRGASILAGTAFGLGGFMGSVGWPQILCSALWLPLALLFLLRVFRGLRPVANAAASGAFLGLMFLSGHHNIPTFTTVFFIALWAVYVASILKKRARLREFAPAAIFFACFALIAAAQVLPAYELGKLSVRWAGAPNPLHWNDTVPYTVHDELSVPPSALPGLIIPWLPKAGWLFVGLVPLTFALLGAFLNWQDRMVRILCAFALGGLLFVLGAFSIFHGILYAVIPNLDKARHPGMAAVLFQLPLAVLAGYGLDAFASFRLNTEWRKFLVRSLCGLAVFLFATVLAMQSLRPEQSREYEALALTSVTALLLAAIVLAQEKLAVRMQRILLLLLLMFELSAPATGSYRLRGSGLVLAKLSEHLDIAEYLRTRPVPVRVEVDDASIPYNFGDWFGIDQFGGYQPGIIEPIASAQGETSMRMLLGVNYYVGPKPMRPDQKLVFESRSGLKVFENPAALPRVRVVHRAQQVGGPALLRGESASLDACDPGDPVTIVSYDPARVKLHASLRCKGMVILSDTWFPGWQAYVDGRPTKIYDAYGLVRGVVVPSGDHEIKFIYRPASVYGGAILALMGLILCVGLQLKPTQP